MMRWHRYCAFVTGVLLLYVVVTGAGVTLADMRALVTHAPDTDPDILMMRQHISGPPNYVVVSAPDYTAPTLPPEFDYVSAIHKAAALGRAASAATDLRLVEIRTAEGKVAGHVQMGAEHLLFDLAGGTALPARFLPMSQPPKNISSLRLSLKKLHRFNYIGQLATALNGVAGIAFCIMIFTGLTHYSRLYKARVNLGQGSPFWRAGDWWRNLHRWIAIGAGILIVWVTLSGLLLSIDNVGAFFSDQLHGKPSGPNPFDGDFSSPLSDEALTAMTRSTLVAYHREMPGAGLKVLRLRYFAGYPQGVVIAEDTSQLVFNTATGKSMSMSEKGYPDLSFPFGWQWHQRLKLMHRGDIIGMSGRWLDTLAGLSLVYLAISGIIMYLQLLVRRRRAGRDALMWK